MAILSTGFGKSMIFTVFAVAKEEMVLIENLYVYDPGCKENHFYSLPFGQAEASIY